MDDEPVTAADPCRCGHTPEAHEHYRRGSDCALCDCRRFRPVLGPGARGSAGGLVRRLRGRRPGR